MKKLKKKLPNISLNVAKSNMNIMERTAYVNQVAKDVMNKIGAEVITRQKEEELVAQAEASMYAAFARTLMYRWNLLRKKETRLKVMYEETKAFLNRLEEPDEEQLAVEKAFSEQTGYRMTRAKCVEEVIERTGATERVYSEHIKNIILLAGETDKVELESRTLISMLSELLERRGEQNG